jgi:16S rRNA (cytosine967-C5)-methyltransferase
VSLCGYTGYVSIPPSSPRKFTPRVIKTPQAARSDNALERGHAAAWPSSSSRSSGKPTTLAVQLQQVALFLIALRAGKSWATAQFDIENTQRAGVQAITFAVLRHLGQGHALRVLLAEKKPVPAADALLTAALALICAQRSLPPPPGAVYEDYVIVSQAVEAIKMQPHLAAQSSFINACLRRFLREGDALMGSLRSDLEAQFNHPEWWIRRVQQDWPQDWRALLQGNRHSPPLTLRINELNSTIASMESALSATEFIADTRMQRVAQAGLQLSRSLPVSQLPGYQEGWFSVQDAAAQVAAPLLMEAVVSAVKTQQPLRILDACAAPGGKTSHLLEWAGRRGIAAQVTALDVDAKRCEIVEENLARLQLKARILARDAARPEDWYEGEPFDGVLLDAPCTASGIVRRHPDIPWLRRDSDIAGLAAQQKRLLDALWPLVKPGGVLLYCTCSVFKAEGCEQIDSFVANNTDALSLPAPGHLLPLKHADGSPMPENSLGEHDGFFYALLRKKV